MIKIPLRQRRALFKQVSAAIIFVQTSQSMVAVSVDQESINCGFLVQCPRFERIAKYVRRDPTKFLKIAP